MPRDSAKNKKRIVDYRVCNGENFNLLDGMDDKGTRGRFNSLKFLGKEILMDEKTTDDKITIRKDCETSWFTRNSSSIR